MHSKIQSRIHHSILNGSNVSSQTSESNQANQDILYKFVMACKVIRQQEEIGTLYTATSGKRRC